MKPRQVAARVLAERPKDDSEAERIRARKAAQKILEAEPAEMRELILAHVKCAMDREVMR